MPPVRTCVACRERDDPDSLIRMVGHPESGEVVVDLSAKLPGRGAWVHPRQTCVDRLQAKPAMLHRALRAEVDVGGLRERIRARVLEAALDGLSMASASGSLVGGHDQLSAALRSDAVRMVVTANDASPRTLASLQNAASDDVIFVQLELGREALGERIGRGARAAVGVRSTRGAAHLRRQLRRLHGLG
jgi:predicted RNA-binding protein YlxR (DUF448 family)